MPDFNVRSDSVNVEQIMEQIRARIREKRGVDYTEQQVRELASVKLEKLIDPRGIRSDLLAKFKARQAEILEPVKLPTYTFEDVTIYESHRWIMRFIRRLLNPLLKLLFNPNPLIQTLHEQAAINKLIVERENVIERQRVERREVDALYYEIIHNLVIEMTRLGLETKNLKMRVESLASRLEFNERRARTLESVVVYKSNEPEQGRSRQADREPRNQTPRGAAPAAPIVATAAPTAEGTPQPAAPDAVAAAPAGEGPGQRSRRRRRRRGRRTGPPASEVMGGSAPDGDTDDGPDEGGDDQAAHEAGGGPHETAETVERAMASESQPHEHRQAEAPVHDEPRREPDPQS